MTEIFAGATEEKPYISQSQLTTYEKCGEIFRRRYIEKEKIPPGIAMLRGTGVHHGAKYNFQQKIESRKDLPVKDIVDVAVASLEFEMGKSGVILTTDEEGRGKSIVVAETKDSVAALAAVYSVEMAPEYQPVIVEERQRIILPTSTHDLLAIMDLADDKDRVVDIKCTSKKKTLNDAHTDEQLTFYALAFYAKTGKLPSEVRFENFVDRTLKSGRKTERNLLISTRTADDCQSIISRINAMIIGLRKGVFIPAHSGSWWCSERFCGYARTCPYFIKPKGATQEAE